MPDNDAARLAAAFRSIADALEGRGSKPLPCSDGNIPAGRLLADIEEMRTTRDYMVDEPSLQDIARAACTVGQVLHHIIEGGDAVDTLADFGLLDE